MRNNYNDSWHKKEIERLDKLLYEVKNNLAKEEEIKRRLAKLQVEVAKIIKDHEENLKDHEQWIRQHEVRLGEHWHHITRLKHK